MPTISRKRRAPTDDNSLATPSRQRRRTAESDEEVDFDAVEEEQNSGSGSTAQLSKKLVRYALSCEYARVTIKRADISSKVLGSHSRKFKEVFIAANNELQDVFGMEMVELPTREKTSVKQKRAAAIAANAEKKTKGSDQWVLRTVLPDAFRIPDIITPPAAPDADAEAAYNSLYTMIIALITLSGGVLSDLKLTRFLKRMNADQNSPLGNTEEVLKRMTKEGYIVKVKESRTSDDSFDYYVGPRGKIEVSDEAIANVVRTVYSGDPVEDLEQRLDRSLGVARAAGREDENGDGEDGGG